MKFGARILKTGLAIVLSLYVAQWVGIEATVFAGIAAAFAIQPSVYKSYQTVLEQAQANIIGALFAILFSLLFGTEPIVIGMVVVLIIAVHLQLKIEQTVSIALVTAIAIMESPVDGFSIYAFQRFSAVMLGVVCAFLVNLAFLPPKYENRLYQSISETTQDIIKWIRLSNYHMTKQNMLKEDIEEFKECLVKLEQVYLLYKDERVYSRKKKYAKARKLVVFRQLLTAANRAFFILSQINRAEHDYQHLPDHVRTPLTQELDTLTRFHEQLLENLRGRTKEVPLEAHHVPIKTRFKELYTLAQNENEPEDEERWMHLFSLVSNLLEYHYELEHLALLLSSFNSFHQEDNELEIKA
ncbi:aromatic acid exporter family protein [Bacillaceae bacterium SIJ1]|uniref:FUSC family protein n=1 Tax=Litoribacterium kuwaitense TaxID=1398745 RepID=UPI0013ECA78A|nr:aromatic acid exporter family protein [Litoribacterium kuwaitense]NGP46578.1 aromatic acid exporter family protein [Litoribacterium kuwaitense]